MHCNYRGSLEWKEMGCQLTTGSDEACKMFDAAVTQIYGFHEDDNLGGVAGTFTKMTNADPDFVMGHVLKNWSLLSSNAMTSRALSDDVARMVHLADTTPGITVREKKHVQAVKLWSQGYMDRATSVWEDILVDHPHDPNAISMASYTYLFQGKSLQIRDCLGRVLPYWKPSMPLYGYLLGLHAFGLEESNMFSQAEEKAKQALTLNPRDAWSTHTMCHVMESTGRPREGISMLESTQNYWEHGKSLACHNYWHWALYFIELGDYETALSILDSQLNPRLSQTSSSVFNLVDVTSLLYRLQFEGVPVEGRWAQVSDMYKEHIDDHLWAFNDLHTFMACLHSEQNDMADKMMASVQDFIREGKGTTRDVTAEVGQEVMKAFTAYKEADFAQAVDLILPVRYRIVELGGSHAQRDLFNLFLIQSAIKSPRPQHHRLARNLLNERKSLNPQSAMTDRLLTKVLQVHEV